MIATGTHIGPYSVIGPLGAGGMGEVYQATDRKLEREVALKVMLAAMASDAGLTHRFVREAKTLAALNHPNIAHIYGFEDWNGVLVIVMELVPGTTLAERLRLGALPASQAIPIARQMADAIVYAHETGVIHRDLKPGNVKLRPDGVVKILDFGLAKAIRANDREGGTLELTSAGIVVGTPAYMAPELLRGAPADVRSDIFAFGVVLFELLTAQHPFLEPSERSHISEAMLSGRPARWPQGGLPVSDALKFIVGKAIEKDARARYQTMRELRNDLALFTRDSGQVNEFADVSQSERQTVLLEDKPSGGGTIQQAKTRHGTSPFVTLSAVTPFRFGLRKSSRSFSGCPTGLRSWCRAVWMVSWARGLSLDSEAPRDSWERAAPGSRWRPMAPRSRSRSVTIAPFGWSPSLADRREPFRCTP
jgi:serine/threonine protein kinase